MRFHILNGLVCIALLSTSFLSCTDGLNVLFDFETESDFTIPAGLNTFETFYFPINRVPTNIENFSVGTDETLITSILPSRASITAPFIAFDWSRIQEVAVYAISIRDPQRREEIFYQDQINFNELNELRLFSSTVDVRDILQEEFVNIEVAFRFRNVTPSEIRGRIRMNFLANGE